MCSCLFPLHSMSLTMGEMHYGIKSLFWIFRKHTTRNENPEHIDELISLRDSGWASVREGGRAESCEEETSIIRQERIR